MSARYIPALSFKWLTPLYDPLLKLVVREEIFRRRLIGQADIQADQSVLDIGCGTGTLTVMIKQSAPGARVTGLDGDPEVLAIARAKAERAGVEIAWDKGLANELPYENNSFDAVVSSFMIHHLTYADKLRTFQEVRRVLRPSGGFHIVDFGPPFNFLTRAQAALMRNFERTADNFAGRIPLMLTEAGFGSVQEAARGMTFFGPIVFYRAVRGE